MEATHKQVWFIEKLMKERECSDYYDTTEAKSIRCGLGFQLSKWQASRFIDELLNCPLKSN